MSDERVAQSKNFLESRGHVVLKTRSYIALMQRLAVARAEAQWCREEMASQRAWAEDNGRETVALRDRISFLYRSALAFGASIDDLRGDPIEH